MSHARNIKPAFFLNEDLADCGSDAKLLFIGLWCLADRDGLMEYRPRRIKAHVFPFEEIAVEPLIQKLIDKGFVTVYKESENYLLKVNNFLKHQTPYHREKESTLQDITPESIIVSDIYTAITQPLPSNKVIPSYIGISNQESVISSINVPKPRKEIVKKMDANDDPLVQLWNATCGQLSQVRELSADRQRKIASRLRERPLAEWREVFKKIMASSFCTGSGRDGWRVTFDWIIANHDNAIKVIEGKYDNHPAGGNHGRRIEGEPSDKFRNVGIEYKIK